MYRREGDICRETLLYCLGSQSEDQVSCSTHPMKNFLPLRKGKVKWRPVFDLFIISEWRCELVSLGVVLSQISEWWVVSTRRRIFSPSQVVRIHWPVIFPQPSLAFLYLIHISPLTSLCPAKLVLMLATLESRISISIKPLQTWWHPSQIVDLNSLHWQQFIASLKFWIHKLTRCSSDREISFLPHEGGEKHEDKEEAVG